MIYILVDVGCKRNAVIISITYAKTQINKIIITGFINEKHMHGAIIEIYVFFSQHNEAIIKWFDIERSKIQQSCNIILNP